MTSGNASDDTVASRIAGLEDGSINVNFSHDCAAAGKRRPHWQDALSDLDLPILLPGDEPAPAVDRSSGIRFYRPDATSIMLPLLEAADEVSRYPPQAYRVAAHTRYRSGIRLWISTVGLNKDVNYGAFAVPILWETMIFQDGDPSHFWRYASRRAALNGHRQVLHLLAAHR